MINLTLSPDELLLLLGTKEAQIFQHSQTVDRLTTENTKLAVHNSELLKDRDMDKIELENLRSRITQATMKLEKI